MENDGAFRQAQIRRVVVGLMFVAAGLLLFFDRRSIFEVFSLWPLVMVGFGVSKIAGACCANCRRSGFWLLGIGLWFTLNQFTSLGYHDTWPLLLVLVGALLMWDAVAPASRCEACTEGHHAG